MSLLSSRVSLHCSRVNHGIPPLLQVYLQQLQDDFHRLGKHSQFHDEPPHLQGVDSIVCGEPPLLQGELRLPLGDPPMLKIDSLQPKDVQQWIQNELQWLQDEPPRLQGKPHSSRMILHCSKVNTHSVQKLKLVFIYLVFTFKFAQHKRIRPHN